MLYRFASLLNTVLLSGIFLAAVPNVLAATRYDAVVTKLQKLNTDNPTTSKLFVLGANDQNQNITGIRIEASNRDSLAADKKVHHLLVATHHGNEGLSVDLAFQFINDLIASIKDPNQPYHQKIQNEVFYVIPVLNISGYNANRREESYSQGGTLDSNRDYPDPCSSDASFKLKSTKALSTLIAQEEIVGAVTIHGYAGTFTYPWGTYTDDPKTLDNDFYSDTGHKAVAINGYRTGTHGEEIYPTVGAFEDWVYYKNGVWSMLLELQNSPDVRKDSQAVLKYFSLLPNERSTQHEHTGRCTSNIADRTLIMGRP